MTYREMHDRLAVIKLQLLAINGSARLSKEARKMEREAERLMKEMKRMDNAIRPRNSEMPSLLKWAYFASILMWNAILIYVVWAVLTGRWR